MDTRTETFTVTLSRPQMERLAAALEAHDAVFPPGTDPDFEYLLACFEAALAEPQEEGQIHGFCL